ncbi:MAG: hypothetical protein ACR2IF_05225 [Terriglobales bacterium]
MFGKKKAESESDAARAQRLLAQYEGLGPKIEDAVGAAVRVIAEAQALAREFDRAAQALGRRGRAMEEVAGDAAAFYLRARFSQSLPRANAMSHPGATYLKVESRGLADWARDYISRVKQQVQELAARPNVLTPQAPAR